MNVLQFAVHKGSQEIVHYLLTCGCNPNECYFDIPLIHVALGHAGNTIIQPFQKIGKNTLTHF